MRFKPLCAALLLALVATLVVPAIAAASCRYGAGAVSVRLPGRPFAAKATADGCWLFVSLTGDPKAGGGIVALLNQDGAFQVVHVVHVSGQPGGIALSHDGRWLAAAAQDRTLLIDVAKLEAGNADSVVAEIPEGAGTSAIYAQFTLDDRALFVSEEQRGRLAVMDVGRALDGAGEGAIIGRVVQGRAPVGLALSPDGQWLYATSETAPESANWPRHCVQEGGKAGKDQAEGMLFVVDVAAAIRSPDNHSVVAAWAAGCGPVRVALSPDGATAWVTARGDNALLGFRTKDLKGVQPTTSPDRRKVGAAPVGVVVRPDGSEVWVANSDRFSKGDVGTLSAVRPLGGETREVASGKFPRELAFLPDGMTLVVTVFSSGEVQFIPTGQAVKLPPFRTIRTSFEGVRRCARSPSSCPPS